MKFILILSFLLLFACTKEQSIKNDRFEKKMACSKYFSYYDTLIEKNKLLQDKDSNANKNTEKVELISICYSPKYNTCVAKFTRDLFTDKSARKKISEECYVEDVLTKASLSFIKIVFDEKTAEFTTPHYDFKKNCRAERAKMECLDMTDLGLGNISL